MAQDSELVIKLLLDDKEALSKLSTALNKMEREAKDKTDSLTKGFGALTVGIGAALVATEGLRRFMSEAIDAAVEQEDAINRLNVAMKNQGTFTEALSLSYQKMAGEFMRSSRFGDEAIENVMQKLIVLGNVGPQQMERATKATLDLASALKIDLESASLLVGKAAEGNTSALQRYGLKIDETIPKSQRFAEALRLIEEKMGGAAQQDITTYSGAVAQLHNAWGEFMEEIGNFVIQNEGVRESIQMTTQAIQTMTEFIQKNHDTLSTAFTAVMQPGGLMGAGAGMAQSLFKKLFGGDEQEQAEAVAAVQTTQQTVGAMQDQFLTERQTIQNTFKDSDLLDTVQKEQMKIDQMKAMWQAYQDEKQGQVLTQQQQEEEKYNFFLETKKKADQSYWVAAGKLRDTFSQGMSNMFQQMMDGNFKFGEAMKQLGIQMVKVLIDYMVQQAINAALSKALMAAHLAASAPIAAATAAAWFPAALFVSLATFGANAAGAAAGIASTTATLAASAAAMAIPGLASGGTVIGGGATLVGENGPEILDLPRGASVIPLGAGLGSGGKGDTYIDIQINYPVMTSKEVAEDFASMIGQKVSEMIDAERRRF